MDIAVCIDRGFVMPTGVMAYSVCVNNPNLDITFHIICDESVSVADKEDLSKTISAFPGKRTVYYCIDSRIANSFPRLMESLPPTSSYYRLFITKILPDTLDKVLYLDGDIVVRKSLQPLWETDIANYAIAATRDRVSEKPELFSRLQYDQDLGYVNAGILLINLRFWRENDVIPTFVEYIQKNYSILTFQDQDVINYVFRDKKILLPLEYNLQQDLLQKDVYSSRKKEILTAIQNPAIIHYSGGYKPWLAYIRQPNPLHNTFYKYQNQTKWKGCRVEFRPLPLRIKNFFAGVLRNMHLKAPLPRIYVDIPPID